MIGLIYTQPIKKVVFLKKSASVIIGEYFKRSKEEAQAVGIAKTIHANGIV
jgi:hypothetical protein